MTDLQPIITAITTAILDHEDTVLYTETSIHPNAEKRAKEALAEILDLGYISALDLPHTSGEAPKWGRVESLNPNIISIEDDDGEPTITLDRAEALQLIADLTAAVNHKYQGA